MRSLRNALLEPSTLELKRNLTAEVSRLGLRVAQLEKQLSEMTKSLVAKDAPTALDEFGDWRVQHNLLMIGLSLSDGQAALVIDMFNNDMLERQALIDQFGSSSNVRATMFRLREVLSTFGIKLSSQYGVGYWLDPEDKQKICSRMHVLRGATPLPQGG